MALKLVCKIDNLKGGCEATKYKDWFYLDGDINLSFFNSNFGAGGEGGATRGGKDGTKKIVAFEPTSISLSTTDTKVVDSILSLVCSGKGLQPKIKVHLIDNADSGGRPVFKVGFYVDTWDAISISVGETSTANINFRYNQIKMDAKDTQIAAEYNFSKKEDKASDIPLD